jgi:hypothetical protein
MPEWIFNTAPANSSDSQPANGSNGAATVPAPAVNGSGSGAQTLHFADESRSLAIDPTVDAPGAAPPPAEPAHVEPDLDALARQVYAVLKRRLSAEKRRVG